MVSPFQRDEIEDKIGALGPNAVCRYGATAYFVSEDGIRVTDGNQSQTVGEGKINRYFASRLNYTQRARVSIAADVENDCSRLPTRQATQRGAMKS